MITERGDCDRRASSCSSPGSPRCAACRRQLPRTVPTAQVQHGRVQVTVYTVGELRATRTVQLAVPPMGGQLQIVKLAETGDAVKAGDVVMEFDAAEQEFNLEQARFDLQLAEQDVVKADTQAAVQDGRRRGCGAARAVRRAPRRARRAEQRAVSAIKAEQNVLTLEEAKQRLRSSSPT